MAGDVEGNIKQLFTKVQGILKKNGPFEVLVNQLATIDKYMLFSINSNYPVETN